LLFFSWSLRYGCFGCNEISFDFFVGVMGLVPF
jgi:hypothetical protein